MVWRIIYSGLSHNNQALIALKDCNPSTNSFQVTPCFHLCSKLHNLNILMNTRALVAACKHYTGYHLENPGVCGICHLRCFCNPQKPDRKVTIRLPTRTKQLIPTKSLDGNFVSSGIMRHEFTVSRYVIAKWNLLLHTVTATLEILCVLCNKLQSISDQGELLIRPIAMRIKIYLVGLGYFCWF